MSENLDAATLMSKGYLEKLADLLDAQGEAGLTEHLERIYRESGGAVKRAEIDRARNAASRITRDRHRRETVAAKDAARARREEEAQAMLVRCQETTLVRDIIDLTALVPVLGQDIAADAGTYRIPGAWQLDTWPNGVSCLVPSDEFPPGRVSSMIVLPVAQVWDDDRRKLTYRIAYQLPAGTWRDVDLPADFGPKHLLRTGLPIINKQAQKAMMQYLGDFTAANNLYEIRDTEAIDALEFLTGWLGQNDRHFPGGLRDQRAEVYGRYTEIMGEHGILISRHKLHAALETEGFSARRVVESWRLKGILILTSQGWTYHRQTLGAAVPESCLAIRRKAVDPDFQPTRLNGEAIRASIQPGKVIPFKPQGKFDQLSAPIQMDLVMIPLTPDGKVDPDQDQVVVDEIVPGEDRDDDKACYFNRLAAKSAMAKAILADPLRDDEDRKTITVAGQPWLMKRQDPRKGKRDEMADEARRSAGGGRIVDDGGARTGHGGGRSNTGNAQAWAAKSGM